jgi:hypothetical protein
MRKLAVFLTVGVTGFACGNGAGSSAPASGTVGGAAFSPAEVVAASAGPAPCTVSGFGTGQVAAVGIRFATFTGSCADLTAATCRSHRSSRSVTVLVARAGTSAASAAITAGTYAVVKGATQFTITTSGAAELAVGSSTTTDAQCADTTSAAQGSLRLDQVSATLVSGHVDVTFDDGGKLQGDFVASVCPFPPDVCTVATAQAICSGAPVCS